MQPGPRGLVAAEAHLMLELERGDGALAGQEQMKRKKPPTQRRLRLLEYRASQQRVLCIALPALVVVRLMIEVQRHEELLRQHGYSVHLSRCKI